MKSAYLMITLLFVSTLTSPTFAKLDSSKLTIAREANSATYGPAVKAFTEAVTFSLIQNQGRAKFGGEKNFYLEVGAQAFDIDDKNLVAFTTNGFAPSSYQTYMLRAGMGLPYGLTTEVGISQVLIDEVLTGLSGSIGIQVFDFSTWVYTDLVPATTINMSVMKSLAGPSTFAVSTQLNLGVYNRAWFAQFSYALQGTYSMLMAISPTVNKFFIRHGIVSHVPISKSLAVQMEIFFPTTSGAVLVAYQF